VLTLACPVKLLALAIVVDNAPSVMHQILASLTDNSLNLLSDGQLQKDLCLFDVGDWRPEFEDSVKLFY
jgi:hypothetical protein